jgi:2-C-methyl-D-erythritol 4-phosphate cytidylyltransferase
VVRYHALIPAAGGGTRFGAARPKQYLTLAGKAVLAHAIERLALAMPLHGTHVLLAPNDGYYERAVGLLPHVTAVRCGGATRAATVRNGLAALRGVADDADWVLVHDAVRPCIDAASLCRLRTELADHPVGGLLAVPMASALKRADAARQVARTEPRDGLWHAQTPQMFRYGVLCEALGHSSADAATDESQAVEALGLRPRLIMGSRINFKITYPDDLALAEALLSAECPSTTSASAAST